MPEKLLSLENVSTGYDYKEIVTNINLSVFSHDFIGVIGPNGGGKTTFIKLLLGQLPVMNGELQWNIRPETGTIGYLPQINIIDKKYPISVKEVVLSGLMGKKRWMNRFSAEDKALADRMLKENDMYEMKNRVIGELSGGQMQRVFLCRALMTQPKLLLLDEPSTYVDQQYENALYEKLRELNKDMAIIMVSHDVGTIASYVKTIACINMEFHYHPSNKISNEQLEMYNCPIKLITHGDVPHTVLHSHK